MKFKDLIIALALSIIFLATCEYEFREIEREVNSNKILGD